MPYTFVFNYIMPNENYAKMTYPQLQISLVRKHYDVLHTLLCTKEYTHIHTCILCQPGRQPLYCHAALAIAAYIKREKQDSLTPQSAKHHTVQPEILAVN